jgi:transient receptor potential cation channel subfamily V protein 5
MSNQIVQIQDLVNSNSNTKLVCFDLNQRGSIGETLLHLCLINGTHTHNALARRLVTVFPNMVNDVYISDDFYGIF